MNNTISIIIPTYNRSEILKRAIDSVYGLNFDEIVLVNDNSKSNFDLNNYINKLLQNYSKIKYIHNLENKGVAEAKNTGIRNSTSDWVTILDDDDYYNKNICNSIKQFIMDNKDADIIHHTIQTKHFNNEIVDYGKKSFTLEELKNENCIPGSSFIKKSIWEKLNGFKNIPWEDWYFWIEAKENGFNFIYYPEIFYFREEQFQSVTSDVHSKISNEEWKKKYINKKE